MSSPTPPQAWPEDFAAASRKFVEDVLGSLSAEQKFQSAEILRALTASMSEDSGRWAEIQGRYYRSHLELWMKLAQAQQAAPVTAPDPGDRRFQASEWRELPYFDYLKQAYLLNARWLNEIVESARLDAPTKKKLRFFTRQLCDAAAPPNFAATNPEVLKLASATNGDSLRRGLELLREDLRKGRISMTDESAFEIGRNIAVTPGAVVFENDLMQLIQYAPATDAVYERPLVIVPPCINKYYILDLQPANSFVRFALSQGHTVFMVSWRNVTEELGHVTWDRYLEDGVIRAIDIARDICGTDKVNVLGFCVGGTLVGAALAVLSARHREAAASVTLLAAMLDFSDTGELAVFVDEAYVRERESESERGGLLRGKQLAITFSSLRANDLIWNYVVNNYLKGREPEPFDLLYWNSDSTNLPGAMFAYYVRNTYLENNLRVPGRLTMCGVPVDLSRVRLPAYVLAARDDHIVPWRTAYQSTQLLGGDSTFVLAASGHIAGVVNPATPRRRHHWLNTASPAAADEWLAGASEHAGSWWPHWSGWLAAHGGATVPARTRLGSERYPALEPAPGRYVRERCA